MFGVRWLAGQVRSGQVRSGQVSGCALHPPGMEAAGSVLPTHADHRQHLLGRSICGASRACPGAPPGSLPRLSPFCASCPPRGQIARRRHCYGCAHAGLSPLGAPSALPLQAPARGYLLGCLSQRPAASSASRQGTTLAGAPRPLSDPPRWTALPTTASAQWRYSANGLRAESRQFVGQRT
jgi:hypothetical protein